MRRAAFAVPLVLVIASSATAVAPAPIQPVPQAAFQAVKPSARPSESPVPVIVEPRRDAPSRPPVAQPEPEPEIWTPTPRPVPVDRVPAGKRWGVKEGARAAKAYAAAKLPLAQYECLVELWRHESGWRWNAENQWSGAYGIPQALPGSKMRSAGSDWRTNPITQVRWGLGYISGRYGSACKAWSHFKARGWY